jgi:hypothetical protein
MSQLSTALQQLEDALRQVPKLAEDDGRFRVQLDVDVPRPV